MNYNEKLKEIETNLFINKEDKLKSQLYGYYTSLILSKKIAPHNSDLEPVMGYFGLEFKPYVYKSRTILLSRVIRLIEKKADDELISSIEEISSYLNNLEDKPETDDSNNIEDNKEKKKKKKKNIFDDIFNQLG